MSEIRYMIGDATQPIGDGPKIIAHVCNDAGRWGAGFTGALSRRWPEPEQVYRNNYRLNPSLAELGSVQLAIAVDDLVSPMILVANMIAQHGIRLKPGEYPPIRYDALAVCLEAVGNYVDKYRPGYTVHMPRIGCGLAGGTWDRVEPLIQKHLVSRGVDVIVYDLPGENVR